MIILGMTDPFCEDNSACILVDGELVAMVEEERLIRFKHAPRIAPHRAIKYCLETAGVTLDEVDYVAVGFDRPRQILAHNMKSKLRHWARRRPVLRTPRQEYRYARQHSFYLAQASRYISDPKKTVFVNHHVAHAASSFYLSGFESANVMSLDGSGGQNAGILCHGDGVRMDILKEVERESSWGVLYERITDKLGFRSHNDEGKIMGLAAYGEPDERGFPFVKWDGEIPWIHLTEFRKYLAGLPTRDRSEALSEESITLAATLQHCIEQACIAMSRYLNEKTGSRNLCMAGGLALNCSMNGKLLQTEHVDNIFIQPAAGDAGTSLGAAVKVWVDKTGKRPNTTFNHPYWGPGFTNEEIEIALKLAKVKYTRPADIGADVASLLVENKIVGWFQGRMEVGPRALGARTILANPRTGEMKDVVNNQVKFREPWRPFAPSMLMGAGNDYVDGAYPSPFMIIAFNTKKEKLDEIPAAIHVDGTCRIQTVDKAVNPRYWHMIDQFGKRTGTPVVLNTSFNVAGQPIVCTPAEALATQFRCGMDYLAVGDFLVSKE